MTDKLSIEYSPYPLEHPTLTIRCRNYSHFLELKEKIEKAFDLYEYVRNQTYDKVTLGGLIQQNQDYKKQIEELAQNQRMEQDKQNEQIVQRLKEKIREYQKQLTRIESIPDKNGKWSKAEVNLLVRNILLHIYDDKNDELQSILGEKTE